MRSLVEELSAWLEGVLKSSHRSTVLYFIFESLSSTILPYHTWSLSPIPVDNPVQYDRITEPVVESDGSCANNQSWLTPRLGHPAPILRLITKKFRYVMFLASIKRENLSCVPSGAAFWIPIHRLFESLFIPLRLWTSIFLSDICPSQVVRSHFTVLQQHSFTDQEGWPMICRRKSSWIKRMKGDACRRYISQFPLSYKWYIMLRNEQSAIHKENTIQPHNASQITHCWIQFYFSYYNLFLILMPFPQSQHPLSKEIEKERKEKKKQHKAHQPPTKSEHLIRFQTKSIKPNVITHLLYQPDPWFDSLTP